MLIPLNVFHEWGRNCRRYRWDISVMSLINKRYEIRGNFSCLLITEYSALIIKYKFSARWDLLPSVIKTMHSVLFEEKSYE